MKRTLSLMAAIIATLAFSACSDNDNPTTPDTPSGGRAVITVNTAALYEEINWVGAIELNLAKDMCISDTVLIYDQSGHLVTKLGAVTKSLEPLTFTVEDLPNGTYTLVAWQAGFFDHETSVSKQFLLADEEELSTLKLMEQHHILAFTDANGLAYATVTVNDNSIEATLTPKLVGSILNLKLEKAPQEYGLEEIDLYRLDQTCKGMYLDPSRSGEDRWIMETLTDTAVPFAYLEQDETDYPHYTLEHGDDMILSAVTWKPVGDDDYEDKEIVKQGHHKLQDGSRVVYYLDIDRISYQPPFFGLEDQLSAWKADRDAGLLVNDPYIKWGGNLAEVEEHMRAKQFWSNGNNELELWEGVGWQRWYYVAPSFTEQYLFETEDGRNLNSVLCICHDDTLPIDLFTKSVQLQGYTYLGKLHYPDTEYYYDMFLSADEKTELLVYANSSGGWMLLYFAVSPEDLDNIVPASLAPASSKVRSIVPDLRRSSPRSATMRDGFTKSIKPTSLLKAHRYSLQ